MLSRRSLLRGATGLAAAVPLSVAARPGAAYATPDSAAGTGTTGSGAATGTTETGAAAGTGVPKTLSAARGPIGTDVTLTPEFPPTHLSVPSGTAVRLRTADGWQPWRTASGCPAGPDGIDGVEPAGDRRSARSRPRVLVPAAGALAYQIRTAGPPAEVIELNTVDGPIRAESAPIADLPLPDGVEPSLARRLGDGDARYGWQPRYLSRAVWGANESYRYNPDGTLDTPPAFFPVQTLTVHHSGEDVPVADPIAHIRGIYHHQAVTQDWGDIGYQLLIDADGRVYEGTYSDADAFPVFGPEPGADGRPVMVNGSHVGGFNAGNVGVCLLGNFMLAPPTAAAVRSLTVVLALLAAATGLDPAGTTNYVNPISGATATLRTISGHQDWHTANPATGATLCPGNHLSARLPRIRTEVARLIRLLP
jgi:hypothetical protein